MLNIFSLGSCLRPGFTIHMSGNKLAFRPEGGTTPVCGETASPYPAVGQRFATISKPVSTTGYGIIVITEVTGEVVDRDLVADVYRDVTEEYLWGRMASARSVWTGSSGLGLRKPGRDSMRLNALGGNQRSRNCA
ncbi:hypothetical protein [Sinorhizobium fredii]|uniref:hypothetical protein n=1 Tax=Rhizobium fredii TaxID=380 RepID=UPI003514DCAF